MAQDIKKLLRDNTDVTHYEMPEGHEKRFETKLDAALHHRRKKSFRGFKIAASIAIIMSIGYFSYRTFTTAETMKEGIAAPQEGHTSEQITLGDISPDLKKIEDYYVANINVALSELSVNTENKQLFNSYMQRLTELNDEYQKLNAELNDLGPNEQTINALINNLQLRLQLLYKLKQKLNELNTLKNENISKEKQA
ncbi:MAG: hypothetical protein AAF934_10150 [Bacteroidota bacterium]